jgi:Siphovirus Gp157
LLESRCEDCSSYRIEIDVERVALGANRFALPRCGKLIGEFRRRKIAKDVMVELDLKKLAAPDFTASIRPGIPALMVIDEAAVPSIYWEPREPRLNRQELANDLKQGAEIAGVILSDPEPVLSVRTK